MLRLASIVAAVFAVIQANQLVASEGPEFTSGQIEFFETHVRPLLVAHCYDCHSTDAAELEAALYVDSRHGMLEGGESGPAVIPGKPDESPLIAAVKYESTEMPPDRKLAPQQIEALATWVEMGAPWPQASSSPGLPIATKEIDWAEARASHWAWQAVEQPCVPSVDSAEAVNAIDNFVVARREQAGLTANQPAKPHILARRMYIDLIGVLPSPEQVQTFVAAADEDRQRAVVALVDQLLQSPMYGERWARHWLDVARYCDGRGGFLDNESLDDAWRYRDWVVDALNADMPINEFIRLQIAGDIKGDKTDAIATGFFALGPTYRSDGGDPDSEAQAKGETLDDRVDTLTRGLLGITGSCARCHDHKFDPVPQQDYYSLAGVFNNTATHNLPLADQEVVDRVDRHRKTVGDLNKQIKALQQKLKQEARKATESEQAQLDAWKNELSSLKENPPPNYDTAHTLREAGSEDMNVAIRGNLRKTGEIAPRRFLRILSGPEPPRFTSGSGRQELADAVVDPSNPLTARVFVNRVWMHHFGVGLVRTPSNFGTLGERPTHPLLLDWLAADFVKNGWSLKRLHRQVMTSATYQLSSAYDSRCYDQDGDNRLLWRKSPQRMDVEAWRDSLLDVTAELDRTSGGPPLADITRNRRRTLYAKVSRNGDMFESDEFLRRFDFPLMRATVAQRPKSIVPQQFLFLLNSEFIVSRAEALAARLTSDEVTIETIEEKIKRAYQLLYSRPPDEAELQIGLEFVASKSASDEGLSAWDQYAQVLLSSNEFMYVR